MPQSHLASSRELGACYLSSLCPVLDQDVSSGCRQEVEDSFTSMTMKEEEAQLERQVRSTENFC